MSEKRRRRINKKPSLSDFFEVDVEKINLKEEGENEYYLFDIPEMHQEEEEEKEQDLFYLSSSNNNNNNITYKRKREEGSFKHSKEKKEFSYTVNRILETQNSLYKIIHPVFHKLISKLTKRWIFSQTDSFTISMSRIELFINSSYCNDSYQTCRKNWPSYMDNLKLLENYGFSVSSKSSGVGGCYNLTLKVPPFSEIDRSAITEKYEMLVSDRMKIVEQDCKKKRKTGSKPSNLFIVIIGDSNKLFEIREAHEKLYNGLEKENYKNYEIMQKYSKQIPSFYTEKCPFNFIYFIGKPEDYNKEEDEELTKQIQEITDSTKIIYSSKVNIEELLSLIKKNIKKI